MKNKNYNEIINMPHHISKNHKRMSISDRAAQFASFQALSGFGDDIEEEMRITEQWIEPEEYEKSIINEKINQIINCKNAFVKITYFVMDELKSGGAYISVKGNIRRVSETERIIVFADNTVIPIDFIKDITINPNL